MADQQRCYFLEIPKELRLQIYEDLLSPDCIDIFSCDEPSIIGIDAGKVAKTPLSLRAIRRVYDEAIAMLYKVHHLKLRPSAISGCLESYEEATGKTLRAFDVNRLAAFRAVHTLNVHLVATDDSSDEDLARKAFLSQYLRPGLKVERLRFVLFEGFLLARSEALKLFKELLAAWASVTNPDVLTVDLETRGGDKIVATWHQKQGKKWTIERCFAVDDEDGEDAGFMFTLIKSIWPNSKV